ncbi:hypothetical protein BDV59DRAFT_96524 [Aspergillus ambiguus]|uniref:uncharacterized protein n=1 Tax=Aspergillus ambiguus TaxID=176160 RepID=UPI003CCC9F45
MGFPQVIHLRYFYMIFLYLISFVDITVGLAYIVPFRLFIHSGWGMLLYYCSLCGYLRQLNHCTLYCVLSCNDGGNPCRGDYRIQ